VKCYAPRLGGEVAGGVHLGSWYPHGDSTKETAVVLVLHPSIYSCTTDCSNSFHGSSVHVNAAAYCFVSVPTEPTELELRVCGGFSHGLGCASLPCKALPLNGAGCQGSAIKKERFQQTWQRNGKVCFAKSIYLTPVSSRLRGRDAGSGSRRSAVLPRWCDVCWRWKKSKGQRVDKSKDKNL
jgi:hypothetical protein